MKDKRLNKIKQHYVIFINGEKFKIMNYIISDNPHKQIRLITKVKGQHFPWNEEVKIEIVTDDRNITVYGVSAGAWHSPTAEEHIYRIIEK